MYLSGAPGVAGPFGSLPGSDGLNMIAGSVSGGIVICRSCWNVREPSGSASRRSPPLRPNELDAGDLLGAFDHLGVDRPGVLPRRLRVAPWRRRRPTIAAGTAFRNLRRDSSSTALQLWEAHRIDYFFSLNPAGIATSASVAVVADRQHLVRRRDRLRCAAAAGRRGCP